MFGQLRAERQRIEILQARLRLLDAAIAYRLPPITSRDFVVNRPASLAVYQLSEEPAHDFAVV
jgi:hypothetical protein